MMSRARGRALAALLLAGCPTSENPPAPDVGGGKDASLEFRREAHEEALELVIPKAEAAFARHDPVAAAAIGREAVPRMPPVGPARGAAVRKEADDAWKEAQGIDGRLLGPAPQVLVQAIRFGLARIRDEHTRRRPWRGDPGWLVREAERVVDALEADAADGTCEACATALAALGEDTATTIRHLGATSEPALAAARVDLAALAQRVMKLPGSEAAAAALTQADEHLAAIAAALPEAATLDHGKPVPAAKTPAEVKRLPARLTKQELRRRLGVGEDEGGNAADLFRKLGPAIGRLEGMAKRREGTDAGEASPVDAARCTAAWGAIEAHAKTNPQLTPQLDCAAAVRRLEGRALTDGELTMALVDLGVIDPSRTARQRDEPAVLGLLTGRLAPPSQRHALRLAVLTALSDDAALVLALREARRSACLAATAFWIHGELGSDEDLGKRLSEHCGFHTPQEWIAAAEARPMAALQGLPLRRLGEGPADVVPLERYWWAPSGLLDVLTRPELVADLPTKPMVDIKIEELGEEQ